MVIKFVCYSCFGNVSLQKYIKKHASNIKCDFCHKKSSKNISITFDELVEKIDQSLSNEYVDPNDLLTMS